MESPGPLAKTGTMPKQSPIIGTSEGRLVAINVQRLVETRLLLQANSGGGKSWAIRRLLEQTHGLVQHIVIDLEDEFHTLREKFDYVLAGRDGGDIPADLRSAQLLARKLRELQVSAIIGIGELKAEQRPLFVKRFLESLIDSPRQYWGPALVIVDEAHVFCPQNGSAESASAVIDLMTRGRKRGLCGVPATQRISKLHKDAAAEANNKLIGRSALDVDTKRAADELGFSGREEQNRLRTLREGEFFCFGPALSDTVRFIKVGGVETTHPRPGQRLSVLPAPPRQAVQRILQYLADLPHEAEEQARTVEDLRRDLAAARDELTRLKRQTPAAPAPDPEIIKRAIDRALVKERRAFRKVFEPFREKVRKMAEQLQQAIPAELEWADADEVYEAVATVAPPEPVRRPPRPAAAVPSGDLTGPEQRILNAVAWLESIGVQQPEQAAVAFLAGYTIGGGAFNNPRGSLHTKGLIAYVGSGRIQLTDEGRSSAQYPDVPLTTETLQQMVLERLPGPERKILQVLIDAYPDNLTSEECARLSGYTQGGGAFNNPRGRLRTMGLIDYPEPGRIAALPVLFLNASRSGHVVA